MGKTFTAWVSNANDLIELMDLKNDLLRYDGLEWDRAMQLFQLSLEQGYTCIVVKEEPEA